MDLNDDGVVNYEEFKNSLIMEVCVCVCVYVSV